MGLENQLTKPQIEVFAFTCIRAAFWELLQGINLGIKLPQPTLAIQRRACLDVKEGFSNAGFSLWSYYD